MIDEYVQVWITKPNREMVQRLDTLVRSGEKVFCTVQIPRLIGETGILESLRQLGYQVERIPC